MSNFHFNGDWFHARTSSSYDELKKVYLLVRASRQKEYAGMRWSAGRHDNKKLYEFAGIIDVEPSTMQTKVRAMMHYGFLAKSQSPIPILPLRWTRLGFLWAALYSVGKNALAEDVYRITLINALSFFAFDQRHYTNDGNEVFPVQKLLQLIKKHGTDKISHDEFSALVDGENDRKGKNASYWRRDLINSGLFEGEEHSDLVLSPHWDGVLDIVRGLDMRKYSTEHIASFVEKQIVPDNPLNGIIRLSLCEMIESKDMPPESVACLEEALADTRDTAQMLPSDTAQMLPSNYDLEKIPKTREFSRTERNAVWTKLVKERFRHSCVVPACNVKLPFVESAHIKPHSADAGAVSHYAHVLNGLCLCRHCHVAFDKGMFTFDRDEKVKVSSSVEKLLEQHPKGVLRESDGKKIDKPSDDCMPFLCSFMSYHRDNIFKQ